MRDGEIGERGVGSRCCVSVPVSVYSSILLLILLFVFICLFLSAPDGWIGWCVDGSATPTAAAQLLLSSRQLMGRGAYMGVRAGRDLTRRQIGFCRRLDP